MARMGSYLERDIALLFESIGFNISINSKEFGFEADVVAKKDNFKILVQTKQYDHSYINVRDLLHQWASKGKHIGIDRTLVVIAGFSISDKDFHLAKELGVYLWDDNILHKLKKIETNKELYEKVGLLLKFKDIIAKKERETKLEALHLAELNEKIKQDRIKKKKIKIRIIISILLAFFLPVIGAGYIYLRKWKRLILFLLLYYSSVSFWIIYNKSILYVFVIFIASIIDCGLLARKGKVRGA